MIKVNKVFDNRDAFEGTNGGNEGKKLFETLKRQLSTNQEYYAVCVSDNDEEFFPIILTKGQAEVYGKEDSLKIIVEYLKKLYPEKEEDIQQHAKQIIPMKKLKVPEGLKESAKKEADSRLKKYNREEISANKMKEVEELLSVIPEDSHVYLVMKINAEETSSGIADLIVKLPYEKAFELSLAGDLSEFVTISDIIEKYEYGKIPRFVSDEEQELRNFFWNEFYKGKKPMELTDSDGRTIWVKVAVDENGKKIKKTIGNVDYYGYAMQVVDKKIPFISERLAKKKIVYSYTTPSDIAKGLTQDSIGNCKEYADILSNRLFSAANYETINTEIGGIKEGNQYSLVVTEQEKRKLFKKAVLYGIDGYIPGIGSGVITYPGRKSPVFRRIGKSGKSEQDPREAS